MCTLIKNSRHAVKKLVYNRTQNIWCLFSLCHGLIMYYLYIQVAKIKDT